MKPLRQAKKSTVGSTEIQQLCDLCGSKESTARSWRQARAGNWLARQEPRPGMVKRC
jgi:hypothetical protein